MFLIRTAVGQSPIHGVGVFAGEDVARGQALWRYAEGYDLTIPVERVAGLPGAFRAYLETYAYVSRFLPGMYVLSCDHAKFINHSDDPNTELKPFLTLAKRPIASGDEITCDYRAFVERWDGFAAPSVPKA